MFRTGLSFGGLLLLAAIMVLATPGLSQARVGGYRGGAYYGGYYAYPYLGYYDSYGPYSVALPPVTYDSGYSYGSSGDPTPSSVAPPANTVAHITVTAPAGAKVWFDDVLTKATGTTREFNTPRLFRGEWYTYTILARWDDSGREVRQSQQVKFTAGDRVNVIFSI
jgi:uncharacterized protein (TIGR03000 family)